MNFGSAKKNLRELQKQCLNLEVEYRRLMKIGEEDTEFGRGIKERMELLKGEAAQLQDTIGDVMDEIKAQSSDTAWADAFKETVQTAGALTMGLVSATEMLGDEYEDFKDTANALVKVLTGVNAAINIINILQRNSKSIKAAEKIETLALAGAIKLDTLARKTNCMWISRATAALVAHSTAMKAIPYVAVIAAVVALTAGMYKLISASNERKKAAEKEAEAAKKQRAEMEQFYKNVG